MRFSRFGFAGLLVLGIFSTAQAQALSGDSIRKGELIEKVTCTNKPDQSYALYVPSNYHSDERRPVIYVLDPAARGKIAIEHFKDAAEKYGWIVAGSNNSRNGQIQRPIDSVNAMWNDTHQRLSIDDHRVYLAGLSGAARAAITIATACSGCVMGVIAEGAGFPVGLAPSPATHFILFGTAGIEDFNFPELRNLDEALTKAGVTHQIKIFDGRHEWAPPAVSTEAVEWMELRAMLSGARLRDNALINEVWQKSMKQAEAYEASKQSYEAYQVYLAMTNAFPALHDLTEVQQQLARLSSSREVKNAMRSEEQQIKKQRELETEMSRLISLRTGNSGSLRDDNSRTTVGNSADPRTNRIPSGTDQSSLTEQNADALSAKNKLQAMFADLQRTSKSAADTGDRRVARRVTAGLYIGLIEQGLNLLETQKQYLAAAGAFEIATEVAPDRPGGFYYLASAYALNRDKKKALQALKQAVDKGFSDAAAIKSNSNFDSLRNEAAYQEILQRLAGAR